MDLYQLWLKKEVPKARSNLGLLLNMCARFETTDPRDHIYALLGLLDTSEFSKDCLDLLQPDYTLPIKDVFLCAAIVAVQTTRRLLTLDAAQSINLTLRYAGPQERVQDLYELPSWVARYDQGAYSDVSPVLIVGRRVDSGLEAIFNVDIALEGVLDVDRLTLSRVTVVMGPVPCLETEEGNAHAARPKLAPCFRGLGNTSTDMEGCEMRDFVKQVALTYTQSFYGTKEDRRDIVANFAAFISAHNKNYNGMSESVFERCLKESCAGDGDDDRFVNRVVRASYDRRLARLLSGHYAMVPLFTKPGDIVCIIYGCLVSLVLRRKDLVHKGHAGEFWQLIGYAYVNGIMNVSYY